MKQVQLTDKKTEESLTYTVEVRDKKGRVIQRISAPSRSYVEQWNQTVNVQALQGSRSIRKTDGAINATGPYNWNLRANGAINIGTRGIVAGTGSTAVAIDDYALETQCVHGTGTDELVHQAVIFTAPAVVGPTCSFTMKRILVNNSGAPIDVREIGCYTNIEGYPSLGFRDVLPGAVTVPDGGSITVIYTIAVTV